MVPTWSLPSACDPCTSWPPLTCHYRSSHYSTVTPAVSRLELSLVKPTPGLTPRFDSR